MQAEAATREPLRTLVLRELEEMKAREISALHVRPLTSIADDMVICCGTSSRHCKAIAHHVVERAKVAGWSPLGIEGEQDGDWILIDLGDVIVHVMLREARDYYQLEKLWDPNWGQSKSTSN